MSEKERLRKQLQKLCQVVHSEFYEQKNNLIGKVLTITDSAIGDPEQRKATKDLVQQAMWGSAYPGQEDNIAYNFRKFAEAQGIEGLWDEVPMAQAVEPVNQYEEIK